jgi:hypothetical protein
MIPYNEQNSNLVKKRFQGLLSWDNIKAGILFGLPNHNQKDSKASYQEMIWNLASYLDLES